MKKIIAMLATLVLTIGCVFGLTACGDEKYVAKAIEGIEAEEYGYCINKNATDHDNLLKTINDVIKDTNIYEVVAYYTAVSNDQTPTVSLDMPNLDDNTNGTLEIYTCSGFEPYEFIDASGDTVIGVDIYMMQLVAEKLNKKVVIHDVDFDGIVGTIATNVNAIGAAGITITQDRKNNADFSNPYYSSVQYIISKEAEGFTKLSQLAGKKIGVQKGTTGCTMVTEAIENGELKDTGAKIFEYDTGAVANAALKQGKIDYIVIDELPAQRLVG